VLHSAAYFFSMAKTYLTYTGVIEALTGVALIFVPSLVGQLLFGSELNSALGTALAMVGGAAVFSLAIGCGMARSTPASLVAVKMLLIYNTAVTLVLLYAVLGLGFKTIPLWGVIIFHIVQTVLGLKIIQTKSL
jgi:hypothetical protein